MTALFSETFGNGTPTLVLLHGVGANGAVFQPLIAALNWPGRIIVPDLRGHGRSPHARHYSWAHHAADVADLLEPNQSAHIVGHSLGSAVAMMLANGMYGVTIDRVTAFGLKIKWTADELAKGEAFATSPVRWFDTREAAVERFLKVAGLFGHLAADDPAVDAGIRQESGRWRLAADNATIRGANASAPDMIAGARAPYRLFCGAKDPMVSVGELREFDAQAFDVEGCGHNVHVEAPQKVAEAIRAWHLG
jgi:pimeloyl-ACP methyl ester carboxylesterase